MKAVEYFLISLHGLWDSLMKYSILPNEASRSVSGDVMLRLKAHQFQVACKLLATGNVRLCLVANNEVYLPPSHPHNSVCNVNETASSASSDRDGLDHNSPVAIVSF